MKSTPPRPTKHLRTQLSARVVRSIYLALSLAIVVILGVAPRAKAAAHVEHFQHIPLPGQMVFDGANVWVTSAEGHGDSGRIITKVRASDGAFVGIYSTPYGASTAAFDGTYIWLADRLIGSNTDTITRLRLDGTVEGTYYAGQNNPFPIIFDGANIWIGANIGGVLVKMRISDAAIIASYPIPSSGSLALVSDGANIWATNYLDETVTKLRASDGTVLGNFQMGGYPAGIAFDGANIWVACLTAGVLRELDLEGNLVREVKLEYAPSLLTFDGSHIWVSAEATPVEKPGRIIEVGLDGRVLQTIRTGREPNGILFDGDNIWCSNFLSGSVTKVIHSH